MANPICIEHSERGADMRAIFLDDEMSSHINFKYAIKGRTELTEVDYFFNPIEALDFIKTNFIDCVFTDISMPVMDGISFAKETKKLCPTCKIVFITGDPQKCVNFKELDVEACLVKPYSDSELIELLIHLSKETS